MPHREGVVQVDLRGHHFEAGEELLAYARRHVGKLGRFLSGLRRLGLAQHIRQELFPAISKLLRHIA